MRTATTLTAIATGLLSAIVTVTSHAQPVDSADSCRDILAQGIIGQELLATSSAANDAYRSWECASSVQTRNEALKLGLRNKLLLYGVPIASTSDFSRDTIESYKRTHCTTIARNRNAEEAMTRVKSFAHPEIVREWSNCMAREQQRTGLRVRYFPINDSVILNISYNLHHTGDQPPRFDGVSSNDNIQCSPSTTLSADTRVPIGDGAIVYTCALTSACRPASLTVNTSNGGVSVTVPPVSGQENEPCCSGRCNHGLTCDRNVCVNCGGIGAACCASQRCEAGGFCQQGTCRACDTDGRLWYRDADGDGYGGAVSVRACARPPGFTVSGGDCDDNNGRVSPSQAQWFSEARPGGSFDYNCDGRIEQHWTTQGRCTDGDTRAVKGWAAAKPPACGQSGSWLVDCDSRGPLSTRRETVNKTQECR